MLPALNAPSAGAEHSAPQILAIAPASETAGSEPNLKSRSVGNTACRCKPESLSLALAHSREKLRSAVVKQNAQ